MKHLLIILLLFNISLLSAQVPTAQELVGIHVVNESDMLAINSPIEGSLIYNSNDKTIYRYTGTEWLSLEETSTLTVNATTGVYTYTDELGTTTTFVSTASTVDTIMVDQSFIAKAAVSGDANQPNTILTLASEYVDTDWTISGNQAIYSGDANYINISAMTYFQQNSANTYARINPELELLKNGVVVSKSASAYQRHATGHDSSSNTIAYIDHNPSPGDVYELRAQQGSNQNDVMNIDLGHFNLIAVKKVNVTRTITTN